MNKVIISGRFTKDIEVRTTQGGQQYTRFTLAVDRGKTKEGKDLGADFINCLAWENRANTLKTYCKKGDKMLLEGKWQTGSYEENGRTVYTNEMVVTGFDFMSIKKAEEQKSDNNIIAEPTYVITDVDLPF